MSSPPEKNSDQKRRKGKRAQRLRNPDWSAPQPGPQPMPLPAPQSMPLPPPVIETDSSSTTFADELSGLASVEVEVLNALVFMSTGNKEAAGQSSRTPSSQSQPPPTEMENVSAEVEIERHDTMVPRRRLVKSTARRTDNGYTCKICNQKFNSPQALGGHSPRCKKRKRESEALKMQSSSDTAMTSSSILTNLDDVTNKKIAIQADMPVARPSVLAVDDVLAADDGLNAIAPQQNIGGGQEPDVLNLAPPNVPPNVGFLDLDLNLPPPPDEDEKMQEPPAVQPHDADHDPTI